jgi:hypothetical protein
VKLALNPDGAVASDVSVLITTARTTRLPRIAHKAMRLMTFSSNNPW